MIRSATLRFNPYAENTYLLYDQTGQCLIVDPGCCNRAEEQALATFVEQNGLKPILVAATHGHVDHICGVSFVTGKWGVPFAMHAADKPLLEAAPSYGLSMGFALDAVAGVDIDLSGVEELKVGDSLVNVIHTPGHAPGHVVFHVPEAGLLLSGDLLFRESIGRTDLPGGDYPALMQSIVERVIPLGAATRIFPGHGPDSTLSHEVMYNPFITEVL